jgi:O-antigen ligase
LNANHQDQPLKVYAFAFGLFLGLCLWKFGDPVVLDHIIIPPATWEDFLEDAWPTHWANWILLPLAVWGLVLILQRGALPGRAVLPSKWLWLLPLAWLAWQFVAATRSVVPDLTVSTLWQLAGCVVCYFLGACLFARGPLTRWLLAGVLAAFAFCLVRGVDQRIFEYPQNYQEMAEGERVGWTNFPPAAVVEMKGEGLILTTNGVDVANPVIMAKFAKGRVCGTLVYPNALAQIILLVWPVSLALAFGATRQLRPMVRWAAIALTLLLGGAVFFWTGSKLGWLLGIGLVGVALLRLDWSKKLKIAALAAVVVLGLGVFAVRFHHYFAAGATSAGARFDYWRAAAQITAANPVLGTGPGTFSQPYSRIKAPTSEMARLAHNDYLEQFCDSGVIGGVAYSAWILVAMTLVARKIWPRPEPAMDGPPGKKRNSAPNTPSEGHFGDKNPFRFAIFLGLLGWFAQGFGEFGLYVPALAWAAFTLLGCLVSRN